MRKGISILYALMMLLSGAQYTIAIHYCGGEVAATKVSLSGQLASCGMATTETSYPSSGNHFAKHCCDNKVVTIGIINNFTAPVSIQEVNPKNILQILFLPVSQSFYYIPDSSFLYTDIGPPGGFSASAVKLNDICAFRI